jgi:hypothetical protein
MIMGHSDIVIIKLLFTNNRSVTESVIVIDIQNSK